MRFRAVAGRVGLLGLLLVLSLAQATDAALSIYLRASVVSWDNPISQHNDELASQSVPWADAAGESLAHARAAAATTGGLVTLPAGPDLASPALGSGITRSPPTA
ncbi:MAG TPA: hypothetical protein VGD07_13860 [Methylomirabilota bacterium]